MRLRARGSDSSLEHLALPPAPLPRTMQALFSPEPGVSPQNHTQARHTNAPLSVAPTLRTGSALLRRPRGSGCWATVL